MNLEKYIFGNYRFVSHILFWIVAWCFLLVMFGHQYGNYKESLVFVTVMLAVSALTTYYTLYYLIPRFLIKRKYGYFFLYALYGLVISVYIELIFTFYYVLKITEFNTLLSPTSIDIFFLIFGTYIIVISASIIKMVKYWYLEKKHSQEINKERIEAELKLLKSQINPHFLFNTLNNIYALALQKSDSTSDAVVKLSKILDYLLYECNDTYVLLEKEIDVIQNYIELEKIRFGDKVQIQFSKNGDFKNLKIAPNLLLPYIENAFKHGVSKLRQAAYLKLDINVSDKKLHFHVENNIKIQDDLLKSSSGIGLSNVEKRLNLLYKNNFELELNADQNVFKVNLKINLEEKNES